MRLQGRVAVVTGSAQGIGKVYALRLASEGAKVVLADILDPEPAARDIRRNGGEALALMTDVSDEHSVRRLIQAATETYGRIDILVNNAAIFGTLPRRRFEDIPLAEWDQVMAINVRGIFLCCREAVPVMKSQRGGKIINIASTTVYKGSPGFLHYVASKGAVIGLSHALARELGRYHIAVNAIAPGLTSSDALRKDPEKWQEHIESMAERRCFRREEVPEDLSGMVVFLASDDGNFITGQTIVVDGGDVMT